MLPVIWSATDSVVVYNYGNCPRKNLLGVGHSHPGDSLCGLSRVDLHSFLYAPFEYGFLACKDGFRAFVKREVRSELMQRGLLAEILTKSF